MIQCYNCDIEISIESKCPNCGVDLRRYKKYLKKEHKIEVEGKTKRYRYMKGIRFTRIYSEDPNSKLVKKYKKKMKKQSGKQVKLRPNIIWENT